MNYTIAEYYELPSMGKIYDVSVNPIVKMMSMTTEHEMQRLNHSDRPLKVMADIIDSCIIEPIGISAYDLSIADYQYLLHKVRVVTYGPDYKFTTNCPICGEQKNHIINLDKIKAVKFKEENNKYLSFELPRSGDRIALNFATPRIMDNIMIRTKELKTQRSEFNGNWELMVQLMSYIKLINGNKMEEFMLENYIRKMMLADSNYIINMQDKFNQSFGLESEVNTDCDGCGYSYKTPFRITGEFYRPSL